jgi:peptidylprolyl isomerase
MLILKKTFILLVLLILVACAKPNAQGKTEGEDVMANRAATLIEDGLYAIINTSKGAMALRLFYNETPLTVTNFVGLAMGKLSNKIKEGPVYDGLNFHRVIANFMIQGGDPKGDGTGGPGYQFADEIVEGFNFDRAGLLAMANAGANTNGSQFFITHQPTPHLNGRHTIFGEVVANEDQKIVNAIAQNDKIISITIVPIGGEAETFVTGISDESFAALKKSYEVDYKALVANVIPNAQLSPKGVYYSILRQGTGDKPTAGATIQAHYEGRLLSNNRVFDSSYERNQPLEFPVGVGYVIPGWDEQLLDMRVGEKRLMVIPAELAYGDSGASGVIPGGAWLVFSVELLAAGN